MRLLSAESTDTTESIGHSWQISNLAGVYGDLTHSQSAYSSVSATDTGTYLDMDGEYAEARTEIGTSQYRETGYFAESAGKSARGNYTTSENTYANRTLSHSVSQRGDNVTADTFLSVSDSATTSYSEQGTFDLNNSVRTRQGTFNAGETKSHKERTTNKSDVTDSIIILDDDLPGQRFRHEESLATGSTSSSSSESGSVTDDAAGSGRAGTGTSSESFFATETSTVSGTESDSYTATASTLSRSLNMREIETTTNERTLLATSAFTETDGERSETATLTADETFNSTYTGDLTSVNSSSAYAHSTDEETGTQEDRTLQWLDSTSTTSSEHQDKSTHSNATHTPVVGGLSVSETFTVISNDTTSGTESTSASHSESVRIATASGESSDVTVTISPVSTSQSTTMFYMESGTMTELPGLGPVVLARFNTDEKNESSTTTSHNYSREVTYTEQEEVVDGTSQSEVSLTSESFSHSYSDTGTYIESNGTRTDTPTISLRERATTDDDHWHSYSHTWHPYQSDLHGYSIDSRTTTLHNVDTATVSSVGDTEMTHDVKSVGFSSGDYFTKSVVYIVDEISESHTSRWSSSSNWDTDRDASLAEQKTSWQKGLDNLQTVLNYAGFVDPTGLTGAINGAIHLGRGNYGAAAFDFLTAVPFGAYVKGAKALGALTKSAGRVAAETAITAGKLVEHSAHAAGRVVQAASHARNAAATAIHSTADAARSLGAAAVAKIPKSKCEIPFVSPAMGWKCFVAGTQVVVAELGEQYWALADVGLGTDDAAGEDRGTPYLTGIVVAGAVAVGVAGSVRLRKPRQPTYFVERAIEQLVGRGLDELLLLPETRPFLSLDGISEHRAIPRSQGAFDLAVLSGVLDEDECQPAFAVECGPAAIRPVTECRGSPAPRHAMGHRQRNLNTDTALELEPTMRCDYAPTDLAEIRRRLRLSGSSRGASGSTAESTGRRTRIAALWLACWLVVAGVLGWSGFPHGTDRPDTRIALQQIGKPPTLTTKSIEDVRVGDQVLSRDEETGERVIERVTDLFPNTTDHLQVITYATTDGSERELRTTDEHPFWVDKHGWKPAQDLKTGDRVLE